MKRVLFILMLLTILGVVFSYAQCDKSKTLTSSKTEYVDNAGNVQRTVDEQTTIEYSKSEIKVMLVEGSNNESKVMSGTVKSDSCNWKIPFKEGKSIIKAILSDERGDARNVTINIEGKDGKISVLVELEQMPDSKIRLSADKFEEKK